MNLFAYGTLQVPSIFERVVGHDAEAFPAMLLHHAAYRVKGKPYPGLFAQEGLRVPGVVYQGISDKEWGALDAFEGDEYERVCVNVLCADGSRCEAQVYMMRSSCREILGDEVWTLAQFKKEGMSAFLKTERFCEDVS